MATEDPESKEDPGVVQIACQVADAKDHEVPGFLIRLKNLMEKHLENSDSLELFKQTVLKYDLLSWCVMALKYDFKMVRQGLEGAVSIVNILCKCSCTVNTSEVQEFAKTSLPEAIESILHLLRQFQRRLMDLPKKSVKAETDQALAEELFEHLNTFITVYRHLCITILNSSDFLRIIMEGDTLTPVAINVAHTIMLINRFCLANVNRGQICALLDEFVYILTVSSSPELASSTTRLLVSMCDSHDDIVIIMVNRFKGLRAILKKWQDQGFSRDLERLVTFLQTGSAQKASLARQKKAASIIWAFYIGWKTRKRLKTMRRNIPALQRSFRKQKQEKDESAVLEKSNRLLEATAKLDRQRSFRQKREKQLRSLEILPARKVPDFIQNEEHKAATAIQAHWRAHSQRKSYNAKKDFHKRVTAAVTIQRAVRKFLAKKKPLPPMQRIETGVIDEHDKLKYQQEISRWQTLHKRGGISHEEGKSIQETTHKHLLNYYRTKYAPARQERKLSSLLARIHTEEETLNHLPALSEMDSESIDRLASNSMMIQRAALLEHGNETKKFTSPWWKRLAVDEDELAKDGW